MCVALISGAALADGGRQASPTREDSQTLKDVQREAALKILKRESREHHPNRAYSECCPSTDIAFNTCRAFIAACRELEGGLGTTSYGGYSCDYRE